MADEAAGTVAETSKAVFDLSLQTGAFGGFTVGIKIDNPWLAGACTLSGVALAAFYISRRYPSQNAVRNALEGNVEGEVDPEVRALENGSILVELFCHTERSFMSFVDDFEAKRVKLRLGEEFNKIGYNEELELTIINHQEVHDKVNHVRHHRQLRFLMNREAINIVLEAINIGTAVVSCLLSTGRVQKAIVILKECWILLYKNAEIMEEKTVKLVLKTIYTELLLTYSLINDYKNVIQYGRKVLVIQRYYGRLEEEKNLSFTLAMLCWSRGEYEEAKEYYERAIFTSREVGDRKGEASALGNMGFVFQSVGEYNKAEEYLQKALQMSKEIRNKKGQLLAFANLGSVFQSVGKYDEAERCLGRALHVSIEIGDREGEALAFANLGSMFQSVGEYDKAEKFLERAFVLSVEIGVRKGEALALASPGSVSESVGKYDISVQTLKVTSK